MQLSDRRPPEPPDTMNLGDFTCTDTEYSEQRTLYGIGISRQKILLQTPGDPTGTRLELSIELSIEQTHPHGFRPGETYSVRFTTTQAYR